MSVAVIGADLPFGHALTTYLQQMDEAVVPVHLSSLLSHENPLAKLVQVFASKGATTYVDATYDEFYPVCVDRQSSDRAAISSAVLRHCQRQGLSYVLVSYHSVFSRNARPVGSRNVLTSFDEYMPPVVGCQSIAVDALHTAEYAVFVATSKINPASRRSADKSFRGYVMRLGPLIYPRHIARNETNWTLTTYLSLMRDNEIFLCPSLKAEVTPLFSGDACEAITQLSLSPQSVPQGVYHLASSNSVSLSRLHSYVTQRFAVNAKLIDLGKRGDFSKVNELSGFVNDTPLDCSRWETTTIGQELGVRSWQQMVDSSGGGRTLHPVLIQ